MPGSKGSDRASAIATGEENTGKLAESITALALQCAPDSKRKLLVDVLTVYARDGKAIVFTRTKREADEVAASLAAHCACMALHGDISQVC